MRRHASKYTSLDSLNADRDSIDWYWKLFAAAASWMILGGFLTLPTAFDNNPALRVNRNVLGIFSVALLTAGFILTAFLCFAIRNWFFRAEAVAQPAVTACALGLLTVFYNFLVSSHYVWNTAALLVTVTASVSTIIYGALLIWTHRRISALKGPSGRDIPLRPSSFGSEAPLWQQGNSDYHANYVANMYPSSRHAPLPPAPPASAMPIAMPLDGVPTEDELTRQQMLQLLMNRAEAAPSPDPSTNTFNRIDWNEPQDDGLLSPSISIERAPPYNGYYAPVARHPQPVAYAQQSVGLLQQERSISDRVWRGDSQDVRARDSRAATGLSGPTEEREERRKQIEAGLRYS